jgi:hypothetical protein
MILRSLLIMDLPGSDGPERVRDGILDAAVELVELGLRGSNGIGSP